PRNLSSDGEADDEEDEISDNSLELWARPWREVFSRAEGGGTLIIEPASKPNSQFLSRLRDTLLEAEVISREPSSIWGPCPHAEKCPLAHGRDWCHFSVPAHVPGTWFEAMSKGLGYERQWLKFSYLWISSQ